MGQWNALLENHNEISENEVSQFHGTLIKTTGDGILATFSGPSQAIECAKSLMVFLKPHNLQIRAAIHTGECEWLDNDLSGIAVNLCSRLLDHAGADETVASRTVRDLAVGSGFEFENRGQHQLKGIPGDWDLFSVKYLQL